MADNLAPLGDPLCIVAAAAPLRGLLVHDAELERHVDDEDAIEHTIQHEPDINSRGSREEPNLERRDQSSCDDIDTSDEGSVIIVRYIGRVLQAFERPEKVAPTVDECARRDRIPG